MRVIEGENELRLTCSRSASGGIALLRCETQDDIVRLPDEIDGVPVTEVGAYVLSERVPDLTGKDTFAVRITCGGTEPKHNAAAIRTVTLPKDAKSVGSYAFYNCRNLERIELTDSVSEFGGGALMNCMSLREVILHAAPSAPTCLPRLLGEYAGELDVRFDEHARLLFPEYVEELEDLSPAHIFQRRIHGAGYSYRQCFDSGVLNFRQYDAALSELLERHDFSVAARVAVRRLAVPFVLSDAAKADVSCGFTHPRRQSGAVLRQGRRDRCLDLPAVARCALCRRCGCRVHVCPRSSADGSAVRSAVSRRQNAVQGTRQIV